MKIFSKPKLSLVIYVVISASLIFLIGSSYYTTTYKKYNTINLNNKTSADILKDNFSISLVIFTKDSLLNSALLKEWLKNAISKKNKNIQEIEDSLKNLTTVINAEIFPDNQGNYVVEIEEAEIVAYLETSGKLNALLSNNKILESPKVLEGKKIVKVVSPSIPEENIRKEIIKVVNFVENKFKEKKGKIEKIYVENPLIKIYFNDLEPEWVCLYPNEWVKCVETLFKITNEYGYLLSKYKELECCYDSVLIAKM